MSEKFDMKEWIELKVALKRLLDFNPAQYSDTFLQRRVLVRLHALKLGSYKEYIAVLEKSRDEQELMRKELTIHVTNFFRDLSMWTELRDKVIPLILEEKGRSKSRTITVWSAGCSSGEEPLSIAMCFLEALGDDLKGFKVSILATDYDAETIKRAKLGEYEEQQFKEIPKGYVEKYFTKSIVNSKIGDISVYTPISKIRSLITYEHNDILSDKKPQHIDLILCRNTVIYFDASTKSKLYEEFHGCLSENGFLILGKTEILQGPARDKFQLFEAHERIHIKI